MDNGPARDNRAERPLPSTRRMLHRQRGAPRLRLPGVEWDTVRRRGTVLHRRSSRTQIVEGCADRDPTSNTWHFVGQIIKAGLQIEALVETPLNAAAVKEAHADPARWYSAARARVMPTTFIIKARKANQ